MILIISQHAQKKMDALGITKNQIRLAIKRGSKYKQTDGFLAKYSYYSVAYKIRGDKYIIKTVYID